MTPRRLVRHQCELQHQYRRDEGARMTSARHAPTIIDACRDGRNLAAVQVVWEGVDLLATSSAGDSARHGQTMLFCRGQTMVYPIPEAIANARAARVFGVCDRRVPTVDRTGAVLAVIHAEPAAVAEASHWRISTGRLCRHCACAGGRRGFANFRRRGPSFLCRSDERRAFDEAGAVLDTPRGP